ncbi:MAG: methylglyoxal synthase [Bacteroidetes bacterium]|nr:methylglyoxal synthase [Bacteroidota bacterium]
MKAVALIAHDNKKQDLLEWAEYNKLTLSTFKLFATGTTGKLISEATDLDIHRYKSGPYGGDMQIGSDIADGQIDAVVFFWDPLAAQPHDVDIKALLRICILYNIPLACNRATANMIISSPLFKSSNPSPNTTSTVSDSKGVHHESQGAPLDPEETS